MITSIFTLKKYFFKNSLKKGYEKRYLFRSNLPFELQNNKRIIMRYFFKHLITANTSVTCSNV